MFKMQWIADHRWELLIGAEVLFYACVAGFFLLRYMWGWERGSLFALGLGLLNEFWIVALGVIDYQETGQISAYQIVIVAVVLYALVQGKEGMRRIDLWMKSQVLRLKGQPIPAELDDYKYGAAKARSERRGWWTHLLIYAAVNGMFWIMYGLSASPDLWYDNETADKVARVWGIVFAVDTVVSWSYTVFPKKRKIEL